MPRLFWIGHAGIQTGMSKVTENICLRLHKKGWDIHVMSMGYSGDPHDLPFKIYPSVDANIGGAPNGLQRVYSLVTKIKPDIVLVQDDSWNVSNVIQYMMTMNLFPPMVGYIAVDGENMPKYTARQLNSLKLAIFHTDFGVEEAQKSGFIGKHLVIPHGVDTEWYTQYDRKEVRQCFSRLIKDPENAFIWGCVAMNQPRKHLDLVMAYWMKWWDLAGKPDNAYLYLHTQPYGVWDLRQLKEYLGGGNNILAPNDGQGLPEDHMPTLYNCFDVMLSCADGEGFGLPHLESMACGVPNIAVDTGGLPAWAGDAIYWVDPVHYYFLPNGTNTKRWLPSEIDFVESMEDLYRDVNLRSQYRERGLRLAWQPRFNWDNIANEFDSALRGVIMKEAPQDAVAEFE